MLISQQNPWILAESNHSTTKDRTIHSTTKEGQWQNKNWEMGKKISWETGEILKSFDKTNVQLYFI